MGPPPKHVLGFLRWFCREAYVEEIEGDLVELFEKRALIDPTKAKILFHWDVLRTFRWVNFKKLKIEIPMMISVISYIKIYFRRLRNEFSHYAVNILGLTLGFSVLFYVLLYVYDEQHIDTFHDKSDRIYRVNEIEHDPDEGPKKWRVTANPLAEALVSEFPEVEAAARMMYFGSTVVKYGDKAFAERNYVLTSKSIFDIWDIEVVSGDPKMNFPGPVAAVLTENLARKLFGDADPVGQVIEMPNRFEEVEVIAVTKAMPRNSSFQFQALYVSDFKDFPDNWQRFFDSWDSRFFATWVLLREGAVPDQLMAKKDAFLRKHLAEDVLPEHDFYLQPIGDIHLGSNDMETFTSEPQLAIPYSNQKFLSVILLIGFGVIVIAGLNFVNLSSVQVLKRSLEAGIRKVNGATQASLRFQLFVETSLTLLIAYILTLLLLAISMPQLNELSGKYFLAEDLLSWTMAAYQVSSLLVIGILTTIIPAVYYARLDRSLALEKNVFAGKGELLRKVFITIQYSLSMILVVAVLVLFRQMSFVQNKDLGFNQEQIITLDINSNPLRDSFRSIKNDLLSHPSVSAVTVSSRVPGEWKYLPMGNIFMNFNEDPTETAIYGVDGDWLETFDIALKSGESYRGNDATDSLYAILNEQAVKVLELEDPIGQSFFLEDDDTVRVKVIGVVEDFHFRSLYEPIGPAVLVHWNNPITWIDYYSIRFSGNPAELLTHIEEVNDRYDPNTPAEINFLDQKWADYYKADQGRSNLFLVGAVVSILISVIGLFGMINYTVERRTKEIGVRKVLGASGFSIMRVLTTDYAALLIVAAVFSFPIAYWWLNNWLNTFSYHVRLSPGIFLLAFVAVLVVSFATVLYRVWNASQANPVKSLRYE